MIASIITFKHTPTHTKSRLRQGLDPGLPTHARNACEGSSREVRFISSIKRSHEWALEAERCGDGANRTKAFKHGTEEEKLPDPDVDGELREMPPERGEFLISVDGSDLPTQPESHAQPLAGRQAGGVVRA